MAPGYVAVGDFPESRSFRGSEELHRGDWASCRQKRGGGFIYKKGRGRGREGKKEIER
jgi:hypothetical protein